MPRELRGILDARFTAASGNCRDLLAAGALLGQTFDVGLVAQVRSWTGVEMDAALREALDQNLVVPTADGGYGFRHALVREHALAHLMPSERRALHHEIAVVLTERGAAGKESALAFHWASAGAADQALVWSLRAARAASGGLAHAEATDLYRQALLGWDEVQGAGELTGLRRIDMRMLAARAALLAGDLNSLESWCLDSLRELDPVSERVLAAQWWALFAEAARLAGAEDERGHRLKRAADLLTGTASSALTATVRADLARFTILRGDPVTGLAEARAALAIATAVHDAAAEAASLSAIATAQPFVDQDPVSTYWAAISRADDAGADVVLHQCYVNLTDAFLRDGRYAECVSAAARGVDALTRRGLLQSCGGTLLGNAAQAMISTGDWASAEIALDRATELEDNAPIKRFLDELRATLLLRRGETSTAMAVLAETTGEVERTARPDDLIRRRTVTAQALLQSTRHLDALEEVLRGLTVVSDSIAWEAAAQLCAIGRQSLVALDQERRSAGKPRDSDQTSISRQQAAEQLLDDVIRLIEPTPGSPAETWLRLAEAERTRVTGPPQPRTSGPTSSNDGQRSAARTSSTTPCCDKPNPSSCWVATATWPANS